MTKNPQIPRKTKQVLQGYPKQAQGKLLQLREWIYQVSQEHKEIGTLQETLKWGEIAFLTPFTKSGTTIRLAWKESSEEFLGMYVNCQTTLIEQYKKKYGALFSFEKNRALLLDLTKPLPKKELIDCIYQALSYHLDKG